MELVDDDGDGKTAVATPRPVVDAPTTPSPAVATIPTPRPVVFAPTPSPSTATDPTMDRPAHALVTWPMDDLTDPPTDADAPTILLAEDEKGSPVPPSSTPMTMTEGPSWTIASSFPPTPSRHGGTVANDGIGADANRDREDREHAGLGGDDVGIL
jgi:hypothetical protein